MKATGMVRKIDELGRLVIPKELRKTLGWDEGDAMEFYVDQDRVVVAKYNPGCLFCGNIDEIKPYSGKNICHKCASEIGSLAVRHDHD